jgi:S-formylglutathione hydrolase FrmB
MKNIILFLSLIAAFAVAGCASTPSQQSHENPPPKAKRVQVLRYDTTPRPATVHLDVLASAPPQRPYKVIALLTCEGAVDQEVVMTTAIYYRARQLGADAVMNAGTITTQKEGTVNVADTVGKQIMMNAVGLGGSGARSVFRVNALVYTDK